MNHQQPLPAGWRWVQLEEVCEQDRRIVEPGSDVAAVLPYLSLEHVESNTGRILRGSAETVQDEGKSTTFAFDSRHVLYGKLRPYLNKVALPNFDGRCTTEIIPLLPTDGTDRYYLAWLLRGGETVNAAMRQRTGSRMPRADIGDLLSLQIPLPSLAEQKRIAAILNEQMGAVERARAAAESQLEAAKALPAAYLRAVFSSPEAKPWPQRRLGDVCGIIGGNTLPPPEECSADDRVYCLKVSDLDGPFSDGREVFGGSFYTSRTTAKNRILGPRSVIFPKRGGAIATNKKRTLKVFAVLDPNLMGVQAIPGSDLLPEFLHFWFQSWDLSALQSGNTVPQINQQDLSPLSVSVPDTPEQQRIAAMLSEQMDSAERARKAIEEELDAINKLPAALLRRAFNGGL